MSHIQKKSTQVQPRANTKSTALKMDPLTVKVLEATTIIKYEITGQGVLKMFHATVATESQFFHVKIFKTNLLFKKNKIITISNYNKCSNGILELKEESSVIEADPDQIIVVPQHVIKSAKETPLIGDLLHGGPVTPVYGWFTLVKKTVLEKRTIYTIKDRTGEMDVEGRTQCHNIKCEEGDPLRLFCFEIASVNNQLMLVSGDHSFIQRISVPRNAPKKDPITVKVLEATDNFKYEISGEKVLRMSYATVATESQFFHVKIFKINLLPKEDKIITISNYNKRKGILELKERCSVTKADPDQIIEVPQHVIKSANETPLIGDLRHGAPVTPVFGLFTLVKKKTNKKSTIYTIEDRTGKMDVVGHRQCHNINCEKGDKLVLFCFGLRRQKHEPKLVSGEHSFIQVIKHEKEEGNSQC